ncbi:protein DETOXIFICATION 35-like [Oryza brachyantha]|uniref:protein DETOXIFICATION 35-like n=1 Tax=Oryza brachyantha TaxID=4533 RepID=UPI001ADCC728|nr:protein DETOXIFICATION 35-like [Oryza brachyantha]
MAYTEPLLLSARHTNQTPPRHLRVGPRSRSRSRHRHAAAADGHMVVAVQDDETGALVAAEGDGDGDGDGPPVAGPDDHADAPVVRSARGAWEVFTAESRRLWAIGAPIAFNIVCLYGTNSTTQIFAGHIGNRELSAVAIGLTVVSNFSFGFLLGMGSALETLCGQAFGAGQVAMLGIYMQRSWIILTASAALLSPLYAFAAPVLRLLGQEESIAAAAGEFTRRIIPQMFALAINFPTQKFLQAQSKVTVLAWIGFTALLAHVVLLALFVSALGWGIAGAAAAYDVSSWLIALAQVAYVVGWCRDGWTGLSRAAFNELWAFLKLSLASAIMLCLEIWYMMVLVVLTGHLDDAEIAVDSISICMNINGWEGMLFIGLNAAISVRVSNELGSGRPRATMHAVAVVLVQSLALGLLAMVLILATRNHFPVIFTGDRRLQKAVANISYLLAVTMVLNSIQPVISGVAVGGGWQGVVAYINLACYYGFGLPLGFIFGYLFRWGVKGIWAGMLCGTAMQTAVLMYMVCQTDWTAEAEQALERVRLWGGQHEHEKLPTSEQDETI